MRKPTFVATAVLAALVAATSLANAQGRHHGGDGGGGRQRNPSRADSGGGNSGGNGGGGERQRAERQAQPRDGGRVDQPRAEQPRAEQPRADTNLRGAQRDNTQRDSVQRNNVQRDNGRQEVTPQQQRRDPQTFAQRNDGNRANGRNDGRDGRYNSSNGQYEGRNGVNRYATPRTGPVPRYRDGDRRAYVQPRRNYYVYGYPSYRYYGGTRYYGYRYYDPGFVGDFYWTNNTWQARSYYGGSNWDYGLGKLRLDIDQRDAEVYIDGYYAGVIDDFDGHLQGLRLEPGSYQVEVALPGFAPLEFDVRITPGRTTTYRGSLLPDYQGSLPPEP
jgi:hypothetical protein